MVLLNVGSGHSRDVPRIYEGWEQDTLDIDANVRPDIVCDARQMSRLPSGKYDAVHSSHCLEHFHKHEILAVLSGFLHVLKPTGFAHVIVPNMTVLFAEIAGRDIDDVWYRSAVGPITFHDVIYGLSRAVAQGNSHYSHKTGFTEKSLAKVLRAAAFKTVITAVDDCGNLFAFAFKVKPSKTRLRRLANADHC